MRWKPSVLFASVAALGVCSAGSGCGKSAPTPALDSGPFVSEAASKWESPSEEECLELADEILIAMHTGEIATANRLIDYQAIIDRGIGDMPGAKQARAGFVSGMMQSFNSGGSLIDQIVAEIQKGGSYSLLRNHEQDGEQRVLFRLIQGEGGVNYHDMVIAKQPGGAVRVIDMYIFMSGELFSRTLRRAFLPLAAEESKSVLEKLTQQENDFLKHFGKYEKMVTAFRGQQYKQMLSIYDTLPETLKRDKNILLLCLQAASMEDDKVYARLIKNFQQWHPDDACLEMISIDGHLLAKQYDEAIAAINRVDKKISGDPYLDSLKANIYMEKGDLAEAERHASQAMLDDSTLLEPRWTMLRLTLPNREFDETARQLRQLGADFELDFNVLRADPELAEFFRSPQAAGF